MPSIPGILRLLLRRVPKQRFYWLCIITSLFALPVGGPGAYAGLCPDGRPGCPDYQPEPQYRLPAQANYAAAPRPRHYEPAAQEALPPCNEKQYAAYSFQRFEPKSYEPEPHRPYDAETVKEWCGIGCWFRRLTSGYCGRGCDYYLYRLNKFPEGTLPKYNHKKVACR